MNNTTELQVVLEQKVGFFTGNFDEIKESLEVKVSEYANMVYSEENYMTAKKDAANLRKLKNSIDEKRIATKKAYMVPAENFDKQCKELIEIVDKSLYPIATQIDIFEEKRRSSKKEAIFAYFQEHVIGLEEYAVFMDVFVEQMLNVNYSIKQWKLDIDNYLTKIETDVKTLSDTNSEFSWKALEDYKVNKDLGRAFKTITLLEEQKREIIAKERAKIEEEKRKQEEELRVKAEAERMAREMLEKERIEKIRQEEEQKRQAELQKERALQAELRRKQEEQARVERERLEAERDRQLAEQRAEFEKKEKERYEREQKLQEEILKKRREDEEKEKARLEKERLVQERMEQAMLLHETYRLLVTGLSKKELLELADVVKAKGYKFTSMKED